MKMFKLFEAEVWSTCFYVYLETEPRGCGNNIKLL